MGTGYKDGTPQKYKTMLLMKFRNLNMGNVWQSKIHRNIVTVYVIYTINILKCKMFVQMAEEDIYKFARAARNQEYLLRLFQRNRTETWNYNLNCLKLSCQSRLCQFDKKWKEEIYYKYSLEFKEL